MPTAWPGQGKEWFDAARSRDLRTVKRLYRSLGPDPTVQWRLLHYDGQGTSYGFVGSTVLHWAAANNDEAMMTFLLASGISVNVQNLGGSTALHSAVANGSQRAVVLLLQNGANVHLADCCGDTPIDLMEQFATRCADPNEATAARAMLLAYTAMLRLIDQAASPSNWTLQDLSAVRNALHVEPSKAVNTAASS